MGKNNFNCYFKILTHLANLRPVGQISQADFPLILIIIRYWNIKQQYLIFNASSCLIVIASQLNYFYGYKRGIDPTFVRVLHSLSDSVTANNIGLKPSDVKNVLKCKTIFQIVGQHNRCFISPCIALVNNCHHHHIIS